VYILPARVAFIIYMEDTGAVREYNKSLGLGKFPDGVYA
jgi:hypothetical protein